MSRHQDYRVCGGFWFCHGRVDRVLIRSLKVHMTIHCFTNTSCLGTSLVTTGRVQGVSTLGFGNAWQCLQSKPDAQVEHVLGI